MEFLEKSLTIFSQSDFSRTKWIVVKKNMSKLKQIWILRTKSQKYVILLSCNTNCEARGPGRGTTQVTHLADQSGAVA